MKKIAWVILGSIAWGAAFLFLSFLPNPLEEVASMLLILPMLLVVVGGSVKLYVSRGHLKDHVWRIAQTHPTLASGVLGPFLILVGTGIGIFTMLIVVEYGYVGVADFFLVQIPLLTSFGLIAGWAVFVGAIFEGVGTYALGYRAVRYCLTPIVCK